MREGEPVSGETCDQRPHKDVRPRLGNKSIACDELLEGICQEIDIFVGNERTCDRQEPHSGSVHQRGDAANERSPIS